MQKRFTSLESLLAMTIIAILASMLFGGIAAVKRRAMNVETQAKIDQLMVAISACDSTYHGLPLTGTIARDRPLTASEYATLTADPTRPDLNPRQEKFLQKPDLFCRDAWLQEFTIAIWSKGRDKADNALDAARSKKDNFSSW